MSGRQTSHRAEACRPPLGRTAAGWASAAALAVLVGCRATGEPQLTYLGEADLNYYRDRATEVAAPAVPTQATDKVVTFPPHKVTDRSRDEVRDLTLVEAVHLTLANNDVIRERGQFLAPSNPLLTNPDQQLTSIYDPAIQETNTQFGNRGVEAALSDFDAQLTSQLFFGQDDRITNQAAAGGRPIGQETFEFDTRLVKPTATGATIGVSGNLQYESSNAPGRLFESAYTSTLEAEFRQPLLAGAGVEFNRIAGPFSRDQRATSGVANGVLIARINSDLQIAEFERSVRNLVRETEEAYWNLALAYRTYHAQTISRNTALEIWRLVQTRVEQGLSGGGTADEAQARESYFDARAGVETALGELYTAELELRRLCGLPVNDGSILRPSDELLEAQFQPDWHASLCDALTKRVELRRQKWQIKSLQLQLVAAKNLARPSLDVIARSRLNGFGDNLLDDGDGPGPGSATESLLSGDQTGYDLGLEFSMPIGLRATMSQVRNLELRLAKSRAALETMEHEISHELAAAFQDVDRFYKVAQTNRSRLEASRDRFEAIETRFRLGVVGENEGATLLDLLLRARQSLAQAEVNYFEAVTAYNQAVADVHLRSGTLLERNNVTLAEGPWDPAAYRQALREAWHRSHACPNPLLHTAPPPFVIPGGVIPTACPAPLCDPADGPAPTEEAEPGAVPPPPAPADLPPADERPDDDPESPGPRWLDPPPAPDAEPKPETPYDPNEPVVAAPPGTANGSTSEPTDERAAPRAERQDADGPVFLRPVVRP